MSGRRGVPEESAPPLRSPRVIAFLNGRLVPIHEARISPLDRGFIFGDGVYEGLRAFGGRVVAKDRHVARMAAGLDEARIPFDARILGTVCDELLRANELADAFMYVQVTRGTPLPGQPVRSRVPVAPLAPTVFAYAASSSGLGEYAAPPTKACITAADTRWLRGRLKSTSLLGGVLAGFEAAEAGADDAILIRRLPDGIEYASEGTSANLIAVIDGHAVTPPLDHAPILAGVTRDLVIEAAGRSGMTIAERPVRASELGRASEIMLCGTLTMVTSITRLNGEGVGDGRAGPVARALLSLLVRAIMEDRT